MIFADGFDLPSELDVKNLTEAPDIEVKGFLKWKASRGEDDIDCQRKSRIKDSRQK
jgi:hypothetical protein